MSKDAFIDSIVDVYPHPDAERLDVVKVRGWQFVVPKSVYTIGEKVLCVMYDGQLDKERIWCTPYVKYLGKNGRVKNTRLRGVFSDGIITKLDDEFLVKDLQENNITESLEKFYEEDKLCSILGITHWTLPAPQDKSIRMCSLPFGIPPSDEEKYQNLSDEELGLGYKGLITKKLDGMSCTIAYNPKEDDLHVCSRNLSLKITDSDGNFCSNDYTEAAKPYFATVKFLANILGTTVALRGEVCGRGIQKLKHNKDQLLPLDFYMYGVYLPDYQKEYVSNRNCYYESCNWHFTKINNLIHRIKNYKDVENTWRYEHHTNTGKVLTDTEWQELLVNVREITTVPILGEEIITKELLEEYRNKPKEFGEGVVINWHGGSYKVKSDDYYYAIKD